MGIYDRIAESGGQNYENIRQGFYQRPEEVRANKLADLQLSNAEMKSREYRQAAPSRQIEDISTTICPHHMATVGFKPITLGF